MTGTTTECVPDDELLLWALSGILQANTSRGRHIEHCAICQGRAAELREIAEGLVGANERESLRADACLDEHALAEVAEGAGDAQQRRDRIAHLAQCGHCRVQLTEIISLLGHADVAAEAQRLRRVSPQRTWTVRALAGTGMIAAAAALVLLVRPDGSTGPDLLHRDPTISATTAPAAIDPAGDVEAVTALRWRAVPGAGMYRVTLFDAKGAVLFEQELADTVVTLPDSVVIAPGRSYLWKVEARTAWERWVSSELIEFRTRDAPASAQDSLRQRARSLSDSALAALIRARPQQVRQALASTLAEAVHGPASAQRSELLLAQRIAAAYAVAWHDTFYVRQVVQFGAWSPERRRTKVTADSLRNEGVTTFSRDGASAALVTWRHALSHAASIGDTAVMAATLGNIGMALVEEGQLDSAGVYLAQSKTLSAAVGDIRVQANAVSELAGVSAAHDDLAAAREQYAHSMALRQRIGDTRGLAADYNNLAGIAQSVGDYREARRQLEAALQLNRADGRPDAAATNLVNLAGIASRTGDYALAQANYRDALSTWRSSARWADVADALRGLGSLELQRGDYPAARTALREALSIYERTGPIADALAVRQSLARAHAASGDLQVAVDALRVAQKLADSANVPAAVRAGILLARADLAVQLNARPTADRLYADAEVLFREGGSSAGAAEAQQGRALLLLSQREPARARTLLDASLRTQLASGNRRAAASSRLLLGEAYLQGGDTSESRRQYSRATTEFARLGDPIATASAMGEHAALAAAMRLPVAAESLYHAALRTVGGRVAPDVTWRLHGGLATLLRNRGATDAAARELRAAITDIERSGRSLALPERRAGFLVDKWDVFVQLALLERSRGHIAEAFDVSERVRAGEMLELLSQGVISDLHDTAATLVAREQDLRRHIATLTASVEGRATDRLLLRGPDVASAEAVTREELLHAQQSYAELMLEIRESAPRHAALVSRNTVTWKDVARHLAPDEAFVEYLLSDEQSMAFLITTDTLVVVPIAASRRSLARLVDFVRGTVQPRGTPRLDSLWRAPLRQMHRDLIGPLDATGLLARVRRLTVVPHAELHYLPFAALLDGARGDEFLVERFIVTVAPSASVWVALGARHSGGAAQGIVALAPRPDALPGSREEVEAIARLGGASSLAITGSAATEAAFRREAPHRRVIHLATFGVLNKQNPMFSFVELGPGGPEDGRLEAHEVFGLRLSAELVVLSACQTALASGALTDVPAGDDWIGLARAFLSAGASQVMASLWPVQDRATAELMVAFYRRFKSGSEPALALALAQRELLSVPRTASPYYWAAFELIGRPGSKY